MRRGPVTRRTHSWSCSLVTIQTATNILLLPCRHESDGLSHLSAAACRVPSLTAENLPPVTRRVCHSRGRSPTRMFAVMEQQRTPRRFEGKVQVARMVNHPVCAVCRQKQGVNDCSRLTCSSSEKLHHLEVCWAAVQPSRVDSVRHSHRHT